MNMYDRVALHGFKGVKLPPSRNHIHKKVDHEMNMYDRVALQGFKGVKLPPSRNHIHIPFHAVT